MSAPLVCHDLGLYDDGGLNKKRKMEKKEVDSSPTLLQPKPASGEITKTALKKQKKAQKALAASATPADSAASSAGAVPASGSVGSSAAETKEGGAVKDKERRRKKKKKEKREVGSHLEAEHGDEANGHTEAPENESHGLNKTKKSKKVPPAPPPPPPSFSEAHNALIASLRSAQGASLSDRLNPDHPSYDATLKAEWKARRVG